MTESSSHAVLLQGGRIGSLLQRGDVARFVFAEDYWSSPGRQVLGLWFEDDPRRSPKAALRLPPWFSNLLPEGPMRDWIARDQGVSIGRELELLLRIGNDLPGAVEVVRDTEGRVDPDLFEGDPTLPRSHIAHASPWKFSLAGVNMKFSLLREGDRLTVPGRGRLGDWIVKFPTTGYPEVPSNEYSMMRFAAGVGIDVPAVDLIHRDALPELPQVMWPGGEEYALAVKRFDRGPGAHRIHIEDFTQVRGWYSERKYDGSFETVAALAFRRRDREALREFVRRLTFYLLIGNGDAHLKNWSFIFPDGRVPHLSPAYDIVSTGCYYPKSAPDTLALKFGKKRHFERVVRNDFLHLQEKLQAESVDVMDVVDATLELFFAVWREGRPVALPEYVYEWVSWHAAEVAKNLVK